MLNITDIRGTVHRVVTDLLMEDEPEIPALTGEEELCALGLSSLLLARLVLELEAATGVDPFADDVLISDVRTLDDLVSVYERGLTAVSV